MGRLIVRATCTCTCTGAHRWSGQSPLPGQVSAISRSNFGPPARANQSWDKAGFELDPESLTRHVRGMSSFVRHIPEGDNRERLVCADCGYVAYENPKVIVGSVVVADGRVLMCRRAIEPRKGFWTLPAGFMELGETLEEGAAREALEEAEAAITIEGILGVFSIARIAQVQVIFRARFSDAGPPVFAAGPESLDVRLFGSDEIPWDEIAFPSVHWALHAWLEAGAGPLGKPAGNPRDDRRGVHRMPPSTAGLQDDAGL